MVGSRGSLLLRRSWSCFLGSRCGGRSGCFRRSAHGCAITELTVEPNAAGAGLRMLVVGRISGMVGPWEGGKLRGTLLIAELASCDLRRDLSLSRSPLPNKRELGLFSFVLGRLDRVSSERS
jgi:hypothetical protein